MPGVMGSSSSKYPVPDDEEERLEALRDLDILDSSPEGTYDALVRLASEICDVPIALMSLVDEDRQWFKAHVGIDVEQTPRGESFCAHAIVSPDEVMVVEDAREDPRFEDNPNVKGPPGFRFYAGAPIKTPDGHGLGTICAIDVEPRSISDREREALEQLGHVVSVLLELRRAARALEETRDKLEARTRELTRSNEELERFAHVVSHDLKSPLSTVIGNLDLVTSRDLDLDPETEACLDDALAGAERTADLLEDLRLYARLDTRARDHETLDVDQVLDDVRSDLKREIDRTDARIEVGDLPAVDGDPNQVYQLFLNLVANAIKFHGEAPPVVEVRGTRAGSRCRFEVADNGRGIEPDEIDDIFEIFHQGAGHDVEGTGLGLAMCKKIVARHGGSIEVASTPGEGSTFSFTLPAA